MEEKVILNALEGIRILNQVMIEKMSSHENPKFRIKLKYIFFLHLALDTSLLTFHGILIQ